MPPIQGILGLQVLGVHSNQDCHITLAGEGQTPGPLLRMPYTGSPPPPAMTTLMSCNFWGVGEFSDTLVGLLQS